MDLSLDTDVLSARTGDRAAFARLVSRYRGLVSSISLSTVGDVATSEDVAQDVFLAAWRDLSTLRNPSSFLPWLRQLTRHRALDAIRGGRRSERRTLLQETALEVAIDPAPNLEHTLLDDERTRAFALALDALPTDAREVLTLYYREGQSIEHVARLLGLRQDTAKKRLSRARESLRAEVLGRFAELVESTAPSDRFTTQVMAALPLLTPAAAIGVVQWALKYLTKWASLALTTAAFLPILIGAASVHYNLRRDLLAALDERERKQLRVVGAVTLLNFLCLGLGVALVGPMLHGSQLRLWLATGLALLFTSVHCAIYGVWIPRVQARRRQAEVLADPSAAERHARAARRGRFFLAVAFALTTAVLVAAWIGA